MINQRSIFFNIDWIIILIYLSLCTIGWFNIHAAVYNPLHPSILDLATNYGKQFMFIVTAILLGSVILLLDNKFFNAFSPIFYGVTLILLVVVLFVGRNVGGNQAWIAIGSFRLQPSEFAKFSTCLLLAKYLSSTNLKLQDIQTLIVSGLILLIPMALIMLQPDTGSALTFTALIFVLYREGLSGYFLIIGAMCIALFVLSLVFNIYIIIAILIVIAVLLIVNNKRNRAFITTISIATVGSIAFIFCVDFGYENIL